MGRNPVTRNEIAKVLSDLKPRSVREIAEEAGLTPKVVGAALDRMWRAGLVLRTRQPIRERTKIFRGRAGTSENLRSYYLYVLKPEGKERLRIGEHEFVPFSTEYLDVRGGGRISKAKLILEFLRKHRDRAWFSVEIAEALKDKGVKVRDIMPTVRRYQRRGLVFVKGFTTAGGRETPTEYGYVITWLDRDKPIERAIEEALKRYEAALNRKRLESPTVERYNRVRELIITQSKLGHLTDVEYITNQLRCSRYQAQDALKRVQQLFGDIKEVKLFDLYKFYYHESMPEAKLRAAIKMKEQYIRAHGGRKHRYGHNWEAVVEWFVETFTPGARFWEQKHRGEGMDPRRITLYLIKNVGKRRRRAEVDRVWEVREDPFSPPTVNVLSCKAGVVRKQDIEDFFEVLRWSKEFGADTPDGRVIKQGVVGKFAAETFDPREKVKLKDGTEITLSQYASRLGITLIKASDFNEMMRKWGCSPKVNVQKICKWAKNEKEVREILTSIYQNPSRAEEILEKVRERNLPLYQFEKKLEESGKC